MFQDLDVLSSSFDSVSPPVTSGFERMEPILLPFLRDDSSFSHEIWHGVLSSLNSMLREMGVKYLTRKTFLWYLKRVMVSRARKGDSLQEIEERLRRVLRRRFSKARDHQYFLRLRAQRSFDLVKNHVIGRSVLDLGAGDGLLGELLALHEHKDVTLVDVIDYNYSSLPLIVYNDGDRLPFENNSFDTTILYTVLHHAQDPVQVFKEAARVTKHRIIIVEGYIEDPFTFTFNAFFDWFLNRVAKDEDVPVPLNYKRIVEWMQLFELNGYTLTLTRYLGIDEVLGPEYHILYVLEKTPQPQAF